MNHFHEECGVLGIYSPRRTQLAPLAYYGLFALQHRGQESCGMVVNDDGLFSFYKDLGLVGDVTVPLSLLVLGSMLAGLPVKSVFSSVRLWILSGLRLLVLAAVLAVLLSFLDISPLVKGVAIVQAAMPMAVNGSMLCLEYGGDTDSMAQATFITTLAALITIPLLAPVLL